jgi:hypothetical protein
MLSRALLEVRKGAHDHIDTLRILRMTLIRLTYEVSTSIIFLMWFFCRLSCEAFEVLLPRLTVSHISVYARRSSSASLAEVGGADEARLPYALYLFSFWEPITELAFDRQLIIRCSCGTWCLTSASRSGLCHLS